MNRADALKKMCETINQCLVEITHGVTGDIKVNIHTDTTNQYVALAVAVDELFMKMMRWKTSQLPADYPLVFQMFGIEYTITNEVIDKVRAAFDD